MLEKIIYSIFCVALTVTCASLVLCIGAWIYQVITEDTFQFLYGIRGDIFAVSAILTVICAFLSNQLDKLNK